MRLYNSGRIFIPVPLKSIMSQAAARMHAVLQRDDIDHNRLADLLKHYGLQLVPTIDGKNIPGSFWGDSEAGLVRSELHARPDTPVHSILHEACHYVCMDEARRTGLHTNAGGDYDEENAVCYLQILLADELPQMGRARMWADMDAWGYSFRLGSAQAWFEQDAEDALLWLLNHQLIDTDHRPTWQLRKS